MKKNTATIILTTVLSISIVTNGCAATASFPGEDAACNPTASESPDETVETPAEAPESTDAVQGGPYGEITLSIPDGWHYETCPTDSGETDYGLYGIRFYPDGVPQGYIALNYIDSFGVCGTGLATEETTIAGHAASIGTYDNLSHWDFITFRDGYDGIVALTYSVDDWWDAYSDQIMEILGTLTFDTSKRSGAAYIYSRESEAEQIGVSFTLKNISSTGATLVFQQYDGDAATGDLSCGTDFLIEMQRDNMWQEVPVILEGEYAFNDVACTIDGSTEQELNWEWLYGALVPGTYRIRKSVLDLRKPGDFDKYTVYAQFILN